LDAKGADTNTWDQTVQRDINYAPEERRDNNVFHDL
jgi:hypothetical protein